MGKDKQRIIYLYKLNYLGKPKEVATHLKQRQLNYLVCNFGKNTKNWPVWPLKTERELYVGFKVIDHQMPRPKFYT
jgi:hypothetical protein